MKPKHKYLRVECPRCKKIVSDNWYIRHIRSGCKVGVSRQKPGGTMSGPMKDKTHAFKFSLKAKGAKKVFAEGFEPGVLVTAEVVFKFPKDFDKNRIAFALIAQEREFIREHIEVVIEEIPTEKK